MAQNNIEIVREVYSKVEAGRLDELQPLFESLSVMEAEGLPYGGQYRGFDQFKQLCQNFAATWDQFSLVVNKILAEGDEVVVLLTVTGVIRGARVKMPVIEVWQLSNGKPQVLRPYYFDTKLVADLAAGKG